ncbi:hypothetical protein Tco_1412993, partial [Tanacetum coccineum]
MVSTMTTHNVGRHTAVTRGGGTSEQDGREGERFGDQVGSGRGSQGGGRGGQGSDRGSQGDGQDGQESDQGSQGSSRGNRANGGGGGVPDFATLIAQQTMNNGQGGCSYKEFIACNPKAYHGKGAGHAAYTGRFHELARLVPHLVTTENKRIERYIYGLALWIRVMVAAIEPTIIQSVVLKARMLTDEAIKNEALEKVTKKRRNNGEPSRDRNARNDNKRSRTGRAFATITNPVRKEYTGPRIVNPLNARNPTTARGACFECGGTDHYKATCP